MHSPIYKILLPLAALVIFVACGDVEATPSTDTQSQGEVDEEQGYDAGSEADNQIEGEADTGHYRSLFSDPDGAWLFVTYHTESDFQLFGLNEDQWSEVVLPEVLGSTPDLEITSLVSEDSEILLSTNEHGAWSLDVEQDQWQSLAADWLDETGHIKRFSKHGDQVYAFYEIDPRSAIGLELWTRIDHDWTFVGHDSPMIIDYLPRQTFLLRSTEYGTLNVSHDDGASWDFVPGLMSALPPELFEWRDTVIVTTTGGVWKTEDDGHSWENVSRQIARFATLMGDELVAADRDGNAGMVDLDEGITHTLPKIPVEYGSYPPEIAASASYLFATNGGGDLLRLSADGERWISVHIDE